MIVYTWTFQLGYHMVLLKGANSPPLQTRLIFKVLILVVAGTWQMSKFALPLGLVFVFYWAVGCTISARNMELHDQKVPMVEIIYSNSKVVHVDSIHLLEEEKELMPNACRENTHTHKKTPSGAISTRNSQAPKFESRNTSSKIYGVNAKGSKTYLLMDRLFRNPFPSLKTPLFRGRSCHWNSGSTLWKLKDNVII